MHNSGRGAKYIVPTRRPVELVYVEEGYTLPNAMKREIRIKRSGKSAKESLAKKNKRYPDPQSK
jgi:predicted GIY-YIG superfamily endonuclease